MNSDECSYRTSVLQEEDIGATGEGQLLSGQSASAVIKRARREPVEEKVNTCFEILSAFWQSLWRLQRTSSADRLFLRWLPVGLSRWARSLQKRRLVLATSLMRETLLQCVDPWKLARSFRWRWDGYSGSSPASPLDWSLTVSWRWLSTCITFVIYLYYCIIWARSGTIKISVVTL